MKLKSLVVATVLGFAAATSAHATLFTFDPTGTAGATGDIQNVSYFDPAPGTALAVGAVPAAVGNSFTLYYQASLQTANFTDNSAAFTNGTGGNYFTFLAGFGETVDSLSPVSPGGNQTATFTFDASNPINYFNIYATSGAPNDLTGSNFLSTTPILQGSVSSVITSNFSSNVNTGFANLDSSPNGDQWAGQQSVQGGGSTNLRVTINAFDANYFPSLNIGDLLALAFNTSQIVPYTQVDPSRCVNTATSSCDAAGGIITTGTLGATNGVNGPNFMFQADGNASIVATAVPEPGTIALIGLGLALSGLARIRRRA